MGEYMGSGIGLGDAMVLAQRNNGNGNGQWDNPFMYLVWLAVLGNNGFGGFGGGGGNGALTRADLTMGFNDQDTRAGIRGIQQGICDGFYAVNTGMLNGFSGVQSALCQGFAGINAAITADTVATTGGIHDLSTQLAQCCCDNRYALATGFADINYNLATQACDTRRAIADSTRDIIASNDAGVRSILDFLTQDKIATLTAENQSLKFAASQANQNAFITANQEAQTAELIRRLSTPCPIPAYVVPNPNCCYDYSVQRNIGCGCANF